jgi:dihydrofolate reductase
MKISVVAAVAENGVIGAKNNLPWRLPADIARFKKITTGHHIIMGRKTHESIGKILPGRVNIVITRNPNYKSKGAIIVNSLEKALSKAEKSGEEEVFIIGGAEIFRQALPLADRIYMTKIKAEFAGDAYFPTIREQEWKTISRKSFKPDAENKYPYDFITLIKKAV